MGEIFYDKNKEKDINIYSKIVQDNTGIMNENKLLNVRKLIKNICKDKNITAKKLCENICLENYYSEFINKGKAISKLMLDLLLQRLGINEGNFEYYLSKKEYQILNIRYNVIDLIERKEIQKAKIEIEKFRVVIDKMDKLHERFVLLMEARIMQLQNESYEKIYLTLKDAVEKTVPGFENRSLDKLVLSYNELFFMIDCIHYKEMVFNKGEEQFYLEIINYIEKKDIDNIIKAKLYAKTVCIIAKRYLLDNKNMILLKYCNKAINYLIKSSKLYYIEKILEYKSLALRNMINTYESKGDKYEIDIKCLNIYKNMYKVNENERRFFCELLERYNISKESYGWYPFNHYNEIYQIGSIIKLRREMFSMSVADLSKISNISEKTIYRIENDENNSYSYTIRNIFNKLGILGEGQVYVFDCSNYKAYKLEKELFHFINSDKFKEAYETLEEFKKNIDLSSKLNQQFFIRKETIILHSLNMISDDEAIHRFSRALEITLPLDSIFSDTKKYFTNLEIMLIYNIALIYKENKDNKNAVKWLKWCDSYYDKFKFDISTYIITYELVMTLYQSLLGNMGNYDKSDEIANKIMYQSLKCRRGGFIGRLIYSSAFNMKKKIEVAMNKMQSHEISKYKSKLEESFMISKIIGDNEMVNFLKNKLLEINH